MSTTSARSRRPTVYDVAHAAGVSTATVSRYFSSPDVLAPPTRDRVAEAVSQLGYVQNAAARRLAGARPGMIALCLPDSGDDEPPIDLTPSTGVARILTDTAAEPDNAFYYSELLWGVETEARNNGLALTVLFERHEALMHRLTRMSGQLEGAVIVDSAMAGAGLPPWAEELPGVLVATSAGSPGLPTVRCDNAAGVRAVVAHLVEQHGNSALQFVAGPADSPDSSARFAGYCAGLAEHGLPVPNQPEWRGDFTRPTAFELGRRILATGTLPEAFVCANDQTALGVMDALQRAHVPVPDQVKIIGFDDIAAARWSKPSLTTVHQPMTMLGRAAVSVLMGRIAADRPVADLTLPVDLVVRSSCGCTRQAEPAS